MTRALLILGLIVAGPAGAYDYRVLHMVEDRNSHVILRISERPEDGDPPERGRADCNDLSALDRRGRNVARAFGRMFQESSIHIDRILTSRVCRQIEAAKLLQIGPVTELDLLDPVADGEVSEDRRDALLGYLDSLRAAETALLITHAAVVEALTGEVLAPGEGLVFTLPPFGEVTVRGRFDLPPQP